MDDKENKYKYLPHTADAKFVAFGKSIEEAFENCAYATFAIILDPNKVNSNMQQKISVSSNRLESLLYDFIEELLFLMDVDGFLLSNIENLKITKNDAGKFTLNCYTYGDYFKNYEVTGNVKSVTYNDMQIKKSIGKDKKEHFEITMVVDI